MVTATNPQTGEKVLWNGKAWVPLGGGGAAVITNPKYQDALATAQGKKDADTLEVADAAIKEGFSNAATADRGMDALNAGTPTGLFSDARIKLSKTPLAGRFGLPSAEEGANLETLRQIGNAGSLGQVGQLKGPLSEKELAFIQQMQVNPEISPIANRRTLEFQAWLAKRQAAYGNAVRAWARQLGAPSATNARGQSFDAWWGEYSNRAIPMPKISPEKRGGNVGENAGGWRIVGEE